MQSATLPPLCCSCRSAHFAPVFVYDQPPDGEIRFAFAAAQAYRREVHRCALCGHFVSIHDLNPGDLYSDDYVQSTYGDAGIKAAFERIAALDPSRSDNVGRVRRILEFAAIHFHPGRPGPPSILDVGSGLCVFLHRMKAANWRCMALDPDNRAVAHAREVVGVDAVCGEFLTVANLGRFDAIAFNKVLEHVDDPVGMLAKAADYLNDDGFVYVEVPDGECAFVEGPGREEFFIDHLHVFSAASLALAVARAGFVVRALERLREPSRKFTLRAFITRG